MRLCGPDQRIRLPLILAATGLLIALGGCGHSTFDQDDGQPAAATANASAKALPKLQKGDKLRITVFGEPHLSGDFTVAETGAILYPSVGALPVAGLTTRDLEQSLATKLTERKIVEPRIAVQVLNERPL
jgi:protein involved in polysaccharide export with SLBB domain